MMDLPDAARASVARIEAMLDESRDLPGLAASSDESAYSLRETERRYLPETLAKYLAIPPSQRDAQANALLEGQLLQLERATAERLATFAQMQRNALAANGGFLDARFGPLETLPPATLAADSPTPTRSTPRALVAQFFEGLGPNATETADLLEQAGARFSRFLPALTTVKRGLFGGPAQAVAIDVPSGDAVLRYALASSRAGIVASVTKVVRGIALRTESVDVDTWFAALVEDVGAYVEHDRATRDRLAQVFGGSR